jgi:hypothetical protein
MSDATTPPTKAMANAKVAARVNFERMVHPLCLLIELQTVAYRQSAGVGEANVAPTPASTMLGRSTP